MFGRRKSVLLVDLDNVMSLLTKDFPANTSVWTGWLADGGFDPKRRKRIFTRKLVYWGGQNDLHRPAFEAAGYIATACPAEVRTKSTTSDVHIIMDAMEWAVRQRGVREVVLLSTDTDFAPLVRRLRERGIEAFVLVNPANPSSVVYRECATGTFTLDDLRASYASEPIFQIASVPGPPPPDPPRKRKAAKAKVNPALLTQTHSFDLADAAARLFAVAAAQPGAPLGRRTVSDTLKSIPGFSTTGRAPWLGCQRYNLMLEALARQDPRLVIRPDANGGVALFAAPDAQT